MLVKKAVNLPSTRIQKSALQYLYARRIAIDALIESLEEYDRCRSRRLGARKRKVN